jgi:IS5 family transposase
MIFAAGWIGLLSSCLKKAHRYPVGNFTNQKGRTMRLRAEAILDFGASAEQPNGIVGKYREEYKLLSQILDKQPKILEGVHRDLEQLSNSTSPRGRKADFTSENLFRAILVMQREGLDYREVSIRIAESETLQRFCRLLKKPTIDFTLLNKAFSEIRNETWEMINHLLALQALSEETISVEHVRTDTTVTECNIHWPTDSSLLWDVYRVAAREMSHGRELDPLSCPWRFHVKKIKKLYLFVTRYSQSTSKKRLRKVRQEMKTLIVRVEDIVEKVAIFVANAERSTCLRLQGIGAALADQLGVMRQIAGVTRRREFEKEKVPNNDKVFSLFEPHTELIMRGRRGRPVEFGHKVLLTQSKEKFITDYSVLENNASDSTLLPVVIERHTEKYGRKPESIAADKGFCPDADTYEELEEQIAYLGVPRSTREFGDTRMGIWQQWRAGIEGTISCLKRAFRLARCCFRGFKNFTSAVGSAVFCHNLTILAKTSGG